MPTDPHPLKTVIVGSPNVGKSALFYALSGTYVTVSNYPGTTVEVARGTLKTSRGLYELVDTPGMYSLYPITEEERVAHQILLLEKPDRVVHVVDAKNLERMLPMTLQLIEAGYPVILVLNMMDEAAEAGMSIDHHQLAVELGIPVVATVSTSFQGIDQLVQALEAEPANQPTRNPLTYPACIESAIDQLITEFAGTLADLPATPRSTALLLIRRDPDLTEWLEHRIPGASRRIEELAAAAEAELPHPVDYHIAIAAREPVHETIGRVVHEGPEQRSIKPRLSRWMTRPLTGLPILFLILYLGLYKFVGGFGAGTVVDFLEEKVFEGMLGPWLLAAAERFVPWAWLSDLLVGEYGVLTLGLRYALAIILPIVTFFFLVFAIIEDTGYLPRLALLIDRVFKKIGLSGRAVIPIVLGLGCDTMATMVTRTLPTRRERVIATLLLALAVPCSAQLGVILALLEGRPLPAFIWTVVIIGVFLFTGFLAARLMPGERPSFYIEVPPLRWPAFSNVMVKTGARVIWYLKEVIPLFAAASVLIWVGQVTRLFDLALHLLRTPVRIIGLPPDAAEIFLFGFFRRDYGAAGLYDLNKDGLLNNEQLVVACVALTLFLPCIAQFLMNVKERGLRTGLTISGWTLVLSFSVAWLLHLVLSIPGVSL